MRVSTRTGDRGYRTMAQWWSIIVRLNGKTMSHVVVADDDAGYVTSAVLDSATGKPRFDLLGDRFFEETVYGRVSIQRQPSGNESQALGRACSKSTP